MTPDPTLNDGLINVDTCVEAYELSYESNGIADPEKCLPDRDHPDFQNIAVELLRVDLEYRWNDGHRGRLEEHLKNYPDVFSHPDAIKQLAFEDYRSRLQAGESTSPQLYAKRYGVDVTGWPDPAPVSSAESFSAICSSGGAANEPPKSDADAAAQLEVHRDTETRFQTATSPGELTSITVDRQFLTFEILEELGAGIGGRVFLARQPALADRRVVIKITHRGTIEAQRLASLQHSNIVPVYSVHDGETLSAICMPYLGSTMLSHWVEHLREHSVMPSTAAEFFTRFVNVCHQQSGSHPETSSNSTARFQLLQKPGDSYVQLVLRIVKLLADGLSHAHLCGILHRDLKPANILLTDDGQPMLLDFHLALRLDDSTKGSESAGGTLPYMSPEQLQSLADDSAAAIDQRADIYSLGVILFELLTGRLPFATSTGQLSEVITRSIKARDVVPSLRQLNPDISPATESIVQKCLQAAPHQRYRDAQQLAEDLRCQLEHRPLANADNPSAGERVRKWFRRHPGATSTTTVSVICGLILLCGITAWNVREHRLDTLLAFQTFSEVNDQLPEVMAALSIPAGDPDERAMAVESAMNVIGRYELPGTTTWTRQPKFQLLEPEQQSELRSRFGELLFLIANTECPLPPTSHAGHSMPATSETVDPATDPPKALLFNRLARACYEDDAIPCALFDQQRKIYQQYGLDTQDLPPRSAEESESTADLIAEGTQLLMQNRPHSAHDIFEDLSLRLPNDFLIWFRLGTCRYRLAQFDGAHDCFTTCLAITPNSRQARYWRGMAAIKSNRFAAARADFQDILDEQPNYDRALVCRGLAWMGEQEWQKAVDDFTAAITNGFSQTRIYFLRSQCYQQLNNQSAARSDREIGLQETPTDSVSWVSRGIARLSTDPQEAIRDFRGAIDANPFEHDAYRNIAHVLSEKLNRPEDALAVMNETLNETNEDALSWMGRAVLHARMKNTDAAHADAVTALKLSNMPLVLYQAACVQALAPQNEGSTETALQFLGQAFHQEDSLIRLALSDADLKPLQSDDRFRKLIAAARIMQMMNTSTASVTDVKN